MKVLTIGQLPKEVGGNYTTGAANVVYELSKRDVVNVSKYTFATNLKNRNAKKICKYDNEYIGYSICLWQIIHSILLHPIKICREFAHYIKVDHENPLRLMLYKENIKEAIKIVKPDLIHLHNVSNISSTKFACEERNIPILMTCHGIFYRGDDKVLGDRYLGNVKFCNFFTGLTEEAKYEMEHILNIPSNKYTIIPNGTDSTRFFYSPEMRKKIREEIGLSESKVVFLTVASLQERKGQFAFLKLLMNSDIDFEYWLIGKGDDEFLIKQYIEEQQANDRVRFMGYKNSNELYKYYSAADVYSHSSWMEGQALSEIEAYSTGLRTIVNKAIVGTVVGNVKTETDHYLIVDFDNYDPVIVKEWIAMEVYPRKSSSKYDWQHIADMYGEIYIKLGSN